MQSIRAKIQDANSELFNHLHQINAQKLDQLIGPQIISDSSPENFKTVVTIIFQKIYYFPIQKNQFSIRA